MFDVLKLKDIVHSGGKFTCDYLIAHGLRRQQGQHGRQWNQLGSYVLLIARRLHKSNSFFIYLLLIF